MGRTNELFVRRFKIIYFHSGLTCSRLAVLPDCLNLLLHSYSYSFLCSSFLSCLSAYLLACFIRSFSSFRRSYNLWLVSYSMTVMVLLLHLVLWYQPTWIYSTWLNRHRHRCPYSLSVVFCRSTKTPSHRRWIIIINLRLVCRRNETERKGIVGK